VLDSYQSVTAIADECARQTESCFVIEPVGPDHAEHALGGKAVLGKPVDASGFGEFPFQVEIRSHKLTAEIVDIVTRKPGWHVDSGEVDAVVWRRKSEELVDVAAYIMRIPSRVLQQRATDQSAHRVRDQ